MILAGTSYSKHKSAVEAAKAAAKGALEKSGAAKADIALFFSSAKYRRYYGDILDTIRGITGAKTIVGASGCGILTEETEIERHGISVMVIQSDSLAASSFLVQNLQENNHLAGETAAKILAQARLQPELMLLFPDPFSFQSSSFFDGFENAYGYVPMIGGAAAEDSRETKTYQMENGRVAYDAVCGLALGGDFRFETGITRSCRPFGDALQITRADGNAIYEIDGRPAYDILLESISHIEFQNPEHIFQNIFLGLPLKNFQTDFSSDHYLVRHIMGVNAKKGMVTCTSPVLEGEFVTFTFRDPNLARQDMRLMLQDVRERIAPSKPALGFYFNCCARGENLFGKPGEDVSLIRQYFPNLPVLGFFTYGELAPVDHVNHLHHHSGVFTVLAEK
jgi:small ligand-binding sensory domain FIST